MEKRQQEARRRRTSTYVCNVCTCTVHSRKDSKPPKKIQQSKSSCHPSNTYAYAAHTISWPSFLNLHISHLCSTQYRLPISPNPRPPPPSLSSQTHNHTPKTYSPTLWSLIKDNTQPPPPLNRPLPTSSYVHIHTVTCVPFVAHHTIQIALPLLGGGTKDLKPGRLHVIYLIKSPIGENMWDVLIKQDYLCDRRKMSFF